MNHIIGVKELRADLAKYMRAVSKGESFLVMHRSKPAFRITSPDESSWETVIDFTKIQKGGIDADELLKLL